MSLPMDDNLRGLLVELAERPERTVLGTRVRRFQDLLRPDVEVLRPSTEMGVVEAKLLEAHREELAWLLLQASRILVADACLLTPRDPQGIAQRVDAQRSHQRAAGFLSLQPQGTHALGGRALLARFLADGEGPPTPLDLSVASLRLVPSKSAKIWIGVHSGLAGDHRRGVHFQRSALEAPTTAFLAGYAWSNIAWHYSSLGRMHDAMEAARTASAIAPHLTRGAISWFLLAVQLGFSSEAIHAAHTLTDASHVFSEEQADYLRKIEILSRSGSWQSTTKAQSLCRELSGKVSPVAEQFLEAFS